MDVFIIGIRKGGGGQNNYFLCYMGSFFATFSPCGCFFAILFLLMEVLFHYVGVFLLFVFIGGFFWACPFYKNFCGRPWYLCMLFLLFQLTVILFFFNIYLFNKSMIVYYSFVAFLLVINTILFIYLNH